MSKKVLWVLASMVVVACQGSDVTNPGRLLETPASLGVSDGANGGNDDFWFLPPMVANPQGNPLYLDNGFNGSLTPTVSVQRTAPTVGLAVILPVTVGAGHYAANWQIPTGAAEYKIAVSVGSIELGSADVKTATNGSGLKNIDTNEFIPLADGKTLPIKFVIEHCALVAGECASKVVNTSQTSTVENDDGGVTIPAQSTGQTVRVTVTGCPDIPTDLPLKSECVRVVTVPPLSGPLNPPATVWACTGLTGPQPPGQPQRYTLYKYDNPPGSTTALPHAHDECPVSVGAAGASVKGMLADLVRGRLKSAGRQLATLIGPKTLYATAMLDVGAGGETPDFSDFQLVLPGSMTTCAGDGVTGTAGSAIVAMVCVTDVGGDAVAGATVHFGAPVSASVVTNGDGEAAVNWTLSLGPNSLTASGNGIGGDDNNGPRDGVDPFQPLSDHFDEDFEGNGPPVPVLTGSVVFSATGVAEPIDGLFNFGSGGWSAKQQGEAVGAPAGWTGLVFDAAGNGFSLNNTQAFGSRAADQAGLCPALTFGAGWSLGNLSPGGGNDILVRKVFSTASATAVQIRLAVDNDLIEVWLNGVKLNASPLVHEGCAAPGSIEDFVYNTTTAAGTNVLAVRARDRGSLAYLNVRVFVPSF